MISYRRLNIDDFEAYHQTLLEAFSDYYVEVQPLAAALRRMNVIEGVNLEFSVGAFDGGKMVGFTANAIGEWLGKSTAYDAGTGVIPAYRRRGISNGMFQYILPVLRQIGVKQYLLEVITENKPAFQLYKNLGFEPQRKLLVFKQDKILPPENAPQNAEIRAIENPDWELLSSFWTYYPSWQNSIDALYRSALDNSIIKGIFGLFLDEKIIGYGIVFKNSGNVSQFAFDENYRGKGFGKILLNALQKQTEKPLFFSNIDESAVGISDFLKSNGFRILTSQYEMLLKL